MQIYSDGKNRVIKGSFPKRFKLKNSGVDVPFLRTAKDSIRLSGEIPVGNLDIEEVINEMTPTPAKLETPSFAIINRSDFDKIDILNKKLAINQSQMNAHLSALTEHEATLANLETQNAKAIDETKSIITEVAKAVGKEIQADRESLINVSESFTSSLNETGKILSNKIDTHEKAKNPHKITKATIGLDRVDNTSDEDKPISKSVKKALDEKADKSEIADVKKDIEKAVKGQDRIVKGIERMNMVGGVGGNELPTGGKKDQVLTKNSNKTGDYSWKDSGGLPDQAGQSGKYLTTNGTVASWGSIDLSGYATEQWVQNQGYLTGITSSDVTTALGYTPYDTSNPSGYTSNVGTVTSVNNVQPDANGNVTINTGSTYTAGTGIDITNNEISVASPTLVNTSTNAYSITIGGNASSVANGVNIGYNSNAEMYGGTAVGFEAKAGYNGTGVGHFANGDSIQAVAIGFYSGTSTYATAIGSYSNGGGQYSTAIGRYSRVQNGASYAIQIGQGTNTEASTFCVGFNNTNYKLLDGTTGKIPDGRLPIATSVDSSSTNAEVVGAKLFYDTCGDIETLINAL